MDALLIDASCNNFGAVGAVQRVQYPISLARKVLEETEQNFFVGAGADALAMRLGMPLIPNIALVSASEQAYFHQQRADVGHDTVGAIAIDQAGHIAVATSTGGTPLKPAGRIGDSPIFGAGGYANQFGGAGATGKGENAYRALLSKYVVDVIQQGQDAQQATDSAIAYIDDMIPDSMVGTIAIDSLGNIGASHSTPKLACGWIDAHGVARASMRGGIKQKVTS